MRWFRAAQDAIAGPETFTSAGAWSSRTVGTTSQAGRRFGEALDRVVGDDRNNNRELQDRNAPETPRWCASLTCSAPVGELPCGPIGRAPKMAGQEAGASGTTRSYGPGWPMLPSRPGFHRDRVAGTHRIRAGAAGTRREVEEAIARLGYVRNRRRARLRHGGPGRSRSSYARTTRTSFPSHSSRPYSEASAGSSRRAQFSLSCS